VPEKGYWPRALSQLNIPECGSCEPEIRGRHGKLLPDWLCGCEPVSSREPAPGRVRSRLGAGAVDIRIIKFIAQALFGSVGVQGLRHNENDHETGDDGLSPALMKMGGRGEDSGQMIFAKRSQQTIENI
jgi:hypothetical protein